MGIWTTGLVEEEDGKKILAEIYFESKHEMWYTDAYMDFDDIDDAIKYLTLMLRDLKQQKKANRRLVVENYNLVDCY